MKEWHKVKVSPLLGFESFGSSGIQACEGKIAKKVLANFTRYWYWFRLIPGPADRETEVFCSESNIMESNSCCCLASSSWCSAPTLDMGTQYLQVDLLSVHILSGFSTQGAVTENFWVSRYHARYSLDGTDWILIEGHEGRIKVTLREFLRSTS